nr:hypothetical protein GCM10020092_065670 [Actinoplanes digitatis]
MFAKRLPLQADPLGRSCGSPDGNEPDGRCRASPPSDEARPTGLPQAGSSSDPRRIEAFMDTTAMVVFVAVVSARFLVPLLIPRYPLPAIIAALVLDGVDQTIFQAMGYDPPGYQGYDKAMDVYYLAIAYLSALRNWTSCRPCRWPSSSTSTG